MILIFSLYYNIVLSALYGYPQNVATCYILDFVDFIQTSSPLLLINELFGLEDVVERSGMLSDKTREYLVKSNSKVRCLY